MFLSVAERIATQLGARIIMAEPIEPQKTILLNKYQFQPLEKIMGPKPQFYKRASQSICWRARGTGDNLVFRFIK